MKTWFITGANRGLGLEVARAALQSGDKVVATARNPKQIEQALEGFAETLYTVPLDVTDRNGVEEAVASAQAWSGRIDVLVNNAGYGQLGAFEEIAAETVSRQFATNVFGVFDVTRAVLPIMRAQRSGHVITISSIAGMQGFEGSSIYCATKHAVSGWSEGLSREVAPFGIKVTCVYPGRFRTDFLDGSSVRYGDRAIEDYAAASSRHRQAFDANNHQQIGDPRRFAEAMMALVGTEETPLWLPTGSDAYAVFANKSTALANNIEQWKELVLSTDF